MKSRLSVDGDPSQLKDFYKAPLLEKIPIKKLHTREMAQRRLDRFGDVKKRLLREHDRYDRWIKHKDTAAAREQPSLRDAIQAAPEGAVIIVTGECQQSVTIDKHNLSLQGIERPRLVGDGKQPVVKVMANGVTIAMASL